MKKQLVHIDGRNGASFFFSAASFADWRRSLEFYRGVSAAAKCKKILLTAAYPLLKYKSNFEGSQFRYGILTQSDSAMISPTGDKIIIHHHGKGYEKIAFGKSLPGVREELRVYRLLAEKCPETFAFSKAEELESGAEMCRFFMYYADGDFSERVPGIAELLRPLKELFLLAGTEKKQWNALWDSLPVDLQGLVPSEDRAGETPVGLVHRDFKPWNVKSGKKPLFFDFESAAFDGCPLEDFFNYFVDPMIRTRSAEKVLHEVRKNISPAESFLDSLGIGRADIWKYFRWHLLERVSFWRERGQKDFAERYRLLFMKAGLCRRD